MTTITINPKYEALRPFIESLPARFAHEGEEIYHARNIIKVFQLSSAEPVLRHPSRSAALRLNVKRFHVPHGPNRLIYSWGIRQPKGRRAYDYPSRLLAKGIMTPEPIALIEERNALGLLGYTYFISEQLDWGHTLYEFGNAREGEYEDIAVALARYAAQMHERGVLHRDFTPGNVLWRRDDDGYHFAVVDINRMYFGPVSERQGLLNLKKFWGPKRFTELLVREYARQRHYDEASAVSLVMDARRRFWTRYQRKHQVAFKLEL